MRNTANAQSSSEPASADNEQSLELHLFIDDPELCSLLEARPEGRERHDFAVDAMKIGALAVRQAEGHIDAGEVRAEGERLLASLSHELIAHQQKFSADLTGMLQNYFDPESGRFSERVQRLVREDGELEQLLRRQLGNDGSVLARTLASHVGAQSPLMKCLDPSASDGLLATLTTAIEEPLRQERDRILREFSLDNKEGALARFISELSEQHGEVGEAMEKRIDAVVSEFSLDREDSGLSRLVNRVEKAQRQISSEFSLDQEDSALARIKRELLEVVNQHQAVTRQFQNDVLEKLTHMAARKQEADRSTRHGEEFEDSVFQFLQSRSQKAGDVATPTGNATGLIRHCRKGDVVIELGPEQAAAGARIVVEAKQDASFTLEKARAELAEARKNRGAETGLFIFSARSAPAGLEPLARYGDDIVLIWDAEDPATDVVLLAGLSIAKALCARSRARRDVEAADFEAIDRAILEIEKQAQGLTEINKSAETVRSGGEKILKRVAIMRTGLSKQIGLLGDKIGDLRSLLGKDGGE